MVQSMSRAGNCWDNAVSESFFSTLKLELIYTREWESHAELEAAVFEYIEVFYNRQRLHSTIDYCTPFEYDCSFAKTPIAA
jgi:transposase InsO family protein